MVNIIKAKKIGFCGGDMTGNHFLIVFRKKIISDMVTDVAQQECSNINYYASAFRYI